MFALACLYPGIDHPGDLLIGAAFAVAIARGKQAIEVLGHGRNRVLGHVDASLLSKSSAARRTRGLGFSTRRFTSSSERSVS